MDRGLPTPSSAQSRPSRIATYAVIGLFLALIAASTVFIGVPVGIAISLIPVGLALLLCVLRYPIAGFTLLFCANYFIVYMIRVTGVDGLSVIFDLLVLLTFLSLILNTAARSGQYNRLRWNGLLIVSLLWAAYCTFEVLNPTAMTSAWIRSRGLTLYMLLLTSLTWMVVRNFKDLKILLYIFSVLTLIGAGKGIAQQLFGFDTYDQQALAEDLARTHLLGSGTRYFSIFASAGIFGAVMAHAMTVLLIAALYVKGKSRIFFLFVAAVAFYGLMISGTRGATAVPVCGLVLFVFLSRRLRYIIPTVTVLAASYIFLAMTNIGQGNQYIRRMRTVLDPQEPSLVVRRENQKLFGEYLKDKPFGEGLGLSGVDAQHISYRFTTTIPTDSWYVKIWVETGIVGLCLHIGILLFVVIYGSYIIIYRIRNDSLRGILSALHCGTFGVLVASYGNQVLGQYPVVLLIYASMAIVFLGPTIDKKLAAGDATANGGETNDKKTE